MAYSEGWLKTQTTVEAFENSHGADPFQLTEWLYQSALPRWEQFKQKIFPGDQLWTYSGGMGNIGIVLMRDGQVVEDFIIIER